jgi:transposase
MELFTLGIALGKTTFHVVEMNQRGEVVLRKRFSRVQLLHFTANLKVKLIGMEAIGGIAFSGASVAGARARGTRGPDTIIRNGV